MINIWRALPSNRNIDPLVKAVLVSFLGTTGLCFRDFNCIPCTLLMTFINHRDKWRPLVFGYVNLLSSWSSFSVSFVINWENYVGWQRLWTREGLHMEFQIHLRSWQTWQLVIASRLWGSRCAPLPWRLESSGLANLETCISGLFKRFNLAEPIRGKLRVD